MSNYLQAVVKMLGSVKPQSFDKWLKSAGGKNPTAESSSGKGAKRGLDFSLEKLHEGQGNDPDEFKDPLFQKKPVLQKASADTVIKNNPGSNSNRTNDTLYLEYNTLDFRQNGTKAETKKFKVGNSNWTSTK
jgi:hypothetical protein